MVRMRSPVRIWVAAPEKLLHRKMQKLFQSVEKSLAEFRVRRRESNTIRFLPRHVRGRKHFARSARRIARCQRAREAQNAAKLSRKSGKATFSTVSFCVEQSTRTGDRILNLIKEVPRARRKAFVFLQTASNFQAHFQAQGHTQAQKCWQIWDITPFNQPRQLDKFIWRAIINTQKGAAG